MYCDNDITLYDGSDGGGSDRLTTALKEEYYRSTKLAYELKMAKAEIASLKAENASLKAAREATKTKTHDDVDNENSDATSSGRYCDGEVEAVFMVTIVTSLVW